MTPRFLSIPLAPIAFCAMTASCAASPPTFVQPPRLVLPEAATTPCRLDLLPEAPTQADLEQGYEARGAALVACDGARRLAVDALTAEHALQDRWTAATAPTARRFRPFRR